MSGAEDRPDLAHLPEPGHKIPSKNYGPFDKEALARYAAASGDGNPIHLDLNAARSAGLSGTPVHGMLMLSCFELFIREWRPDLFVAGLSCKFLKPVFAGDCICISGRAVSRRDFPRREAILRLVAHGPDNKLAILGEVTVRCGTAACPR
jgi:acyl dehydratase